MRRGRDEIGLVAVWLKWFFAVFILTVPRLPNVCFVEMLCPCLDLASVKETFLTSCWVGHHLLML